MWEGGGGEGAAATSCPGCCRACNVRSLWPTARTIASRCVGGSRSWDSTWPPHVRTALPYSAAPRATPCRNSPRVLPLGPHQHTHLRALRSLFAQPLTHACAVRNRLGEAEPPSQDSTGHTAAAVSATQSLRLAQALLARPGASCTALCSSIGCSWALLCVIPARAGVGLWSPPALARPHSGPGGGRRRRWRLRP